jgi:signal transduction histidine kinase
VISITANTMEHDRADPEMHYLCEQLHADVCICLEIYDTGCGMDEETVEKVFDPFFSTKFAGPGRDCGRQRAGPRYNVPGSASRAR